MYKEDLVLNTLQWLVCHKTKPNLYTNQVLLSNSTNSAQKCTPKFFFSPLFRKSSNPIFFFYPIAVFFYPIKQFVP